MYGAARKRGSFEGGKKKKKRHQGREMHHADDLVVNTSIKNKGEDFYTTTEEVLHPEQETKRKKSIHPREREKRSQGEDQ